jgi:hypothetical protein
MSAGDAGGTLFLGGAVGWTPRAVVSGDLPAWTGAGFAPAGAVGLVEGGGDFSAVDFALVAGVVALGAGAAGADGRVVGLGGVAATLARGRAGGGALEGLADGDGGADAAGRGNVGCCFGGGFVGTTTGAVALAVAGRAGGAGVPVLAGAGFVTAADFGAAPTAAGLSWATG